MVKKSLIVTVLALAPLASVVAQEDSRGYAGAAYSLVEVSTPGSDWGYDVLSVIGGYKFNQCIGVEARLGTGISGNTETVRALPAGQFDLESDVELLSSVLAKASYPVTEQFSLYAMGGVSHYKVDISDSQTTMNGEFQVVVGSDDSETGLSYGVGANYTIAERYRLSAEYQILPSYEWSNGDSDVESLNIGLSYSF